MSVLGTIVLAAVCAAVAGALVAAYGSMPRARSLWWVASVGAGMAAVLGAWSRAPVAVALAGAGLAAAAVIDGVEHRIPASLAHGTTVASVVALVTYGWRSADWTPLAGAATLTAGVVALFSIVWVAGGMGYGDVRLAASTVTASLAGLAGAVTLLGGAFATAGVAAAVRRQRGGRHARIPFAPALAIGWLLAVTTT